MFLRNAHVKQPLAILPHQLQQSCASRHGCGNGADPAVIVGKLHHGIAKAVGKGSGFRPQLFAGIGVKLADPVEFGRILLRKGIAVSLLRHNMNQNRLPQLLGSGQQGDQPRQIVAVRRPQIGKAHIFKHGRGQQKPLDAILDPAGPVINHLAAGDFLHKFTVGPLCFQIIFAGTQTGQMPGHTAHIFPDGHFIIIENDDHRLPADGSIVHALIGHSAGHGTIANERHHIIVFPQHRPGPGHTQGNGYGAGSMTGHKGIGIAFTGLGEAGDPAVLAQMGKILPAARQDFMHIGLVSHIENKTIPAGIKHGFNGDAQLYRAQISGKMSAGLGYAGNEKLPNLMTQLNFFFVTQSQQVLVTVDLLQKIHDVSQPIIYFSFWKRRRECAARNTKCGLHHGRFPYWN